MKLNNGIVIIILLLSLIFTPFDKAFADNNLVRLDLTKGNGNAVDITFFTSENYDGNVIVRKKSDNKYVILLPKVLTSGYGRTDLDSVKSLVTNIDVKSINDGAAGYTKITMITSKPLNITTHVSKAMPLTDGQKQYQNLIAEAHTVKSNTAVQKIRNNENTENTAQAHTISVNTQTQQNVKPAASQNQASKSEKQLKTTDKPVSTVKKQPVPLKEIPELSSNSKKYVSTSENNTAEPQNITEELPALPETLNQTAQIKNDNVNIQKSDTSHVTIFLRIKNKLRQIKEPVRQDMPAGTAVFLIILIPILALITLVRFINSSLQSAKVMKKKFRERISQKINTSDYSNIITDETLNWQEKYQMYINQTNSDKITADTNKYKFIQKTSGTVEEQRQKLERLVTPEINEEIDNTPISSEKVAVQREEDAIAETLKNTIKIKAFEPLLNKTRRSTKKFAKSRFTRFEISERHNLNTTPVLEVKPLSQKPIEMKKSSLSTNPVTSYKIKRNTVAKDDYIMSSLEEFFAPRENSVAETLAQIKPSMKMKRPESLIRRMSTNPISAKKAETSKPSFSGLIVKTGCNIDENRGFYIVNLDGTSALIGRIKDEIFVLKKFDDESDKHLQIRHDKDNIYMVKTDGFKSLVDAGNMEVLIEL